MAIAHIATVDFPEDLMPWYEEKVAEGKVWAFAIDPCSDEMDDWQLGDDDLMTTDEMLKQSVLDIREDGFCKIYLDMVIHDEEYQDKFAKAIESVFGKPEICKIAWGRARVWEKRAVGRPPTGEAKVSRTIRLPQDIDEWVNQKAADEGSDRTQTITNILLEKMIASK